METKTPTFSPLHPGTPFHSIKKEIERAHKIKIIPCDKMPSKHRKMRKTRTEIKSHPANKRL